MPDYLPNTRLKKNTAVEATILPDGRWLLFDRASNQMTVLNAPAGIFWELCDGVTPLADVVAEMARLYESADRAELEAETQRIISTLVEQELLAYA